jgi:hypothetical protein
MQEASEKFMYFSHRRSFRKLGQRVKDFAERWGSNSPFQVVQNCLEHIVMCEDLEQTFDIGMGDLEFEIVKHFVQEHSILSPKLYKFKIDPSNVTSWVKLFHHLWKKLEAQLLDKTPSQPDTAPVRRRVISAAPDSVTTEVICVTVSCLWSLRVILKHILFLPVAELESGLLLAGTSTSPSPIVFHSPCKQRIRNRWPG